MSAVLPHRADMKTGDHRQPCRHAYASHEGPCVPTDDFHEHDASGCLDCACVSAPMNSTPCICPEWARRSTRLRNITLLRTASETMRAAWEDENADPAEAEFYLAVADWLGSEDTHHFGPTEHAINAARAYLGRDA